MAPPPPPTLHLPPFFIISQSLLQSATIAAPLNNIQEGIVSILLSTEDLAKIDLSCLQLLPVHAYNSSVTTRLPAPPTLFPPATCNFVAPQSVQDKHASSDQRQQESFGAPQHARVDSFSFQTPIFLSPDVHLSSTDISIPVFKSKALIQAEEHLADYSSPTTILTPGWKRRIMSMDELTVNQQFSHASTELAETFTRTPMKTHDSSAIITSSGQSRLRTSVPLPVLEIKRPELEDKAETLRKKHTERILNRALSKVRDEARIDLKASPAAKFLIQLMPWELTPSPMTPAKTPIAIPFLWEEAPGKPKIGRLPSPFPALQPPPRLTVVSSRTTDRLPSESDAKSYHRKNTHSWHLLQDLFSGNSLSEEKPLRDQPRIQPTHLSSVTTLAETDTSYVSFNSSNHVDVDSTTPPQETPLMDCQIPSPYVGTFTPLTSPYRNLGPAEDDFENGGRRSITGTGLRTFLRRIWKERRGLQKKRNGEPRTEPSAAMLANYFHKSKRKGENAVESDYSYWGDGEKQYTRTPGVYQEGSSFTNAAAMNATGLRNEQVQMKQEGDGGTDTFRIAEGAGRRKRGRIFRRLRRARLLAALCKAFKRLIVSRKGSQRRKAVTDSKKLLHYQSLRSET